MTLWLAAMGAPHNAILVRTPPVIILYEKRIELELFLTIKLTT